MKLLIKLISKFAELSITRIDFLANLKWFNEPFTNNPLANKDEYEKLFIEARKNTYSLTEVDDYEKETNFSIDRNWIDNLAFYTQVVIKESPLNYAHGRLLYSTLRKFIKSNEINTKNINIFETGTARGFSSLCMAKALSDSKIDGKICTFDVLPNNKKILWNSITDHSLGSITRMRLLDDWKILVDQYLIFIQGYSRHMLPKISISRIHFAFLDGAHTYQDVMFEFKKICTYQIKGDMIFFDDYNSQEFEGIVQAINDIEKNFGYKINKILNEKFKRGYVIATKL
jgi:predicted O-methyltransferase YrrM